MNLRLLSYYRVLVRNETESVILDLESSFFQRSLLSLHFYLGTLSP